MKRQVELEEKLLEFLYLWLRPIRIGDLIKELEKEKIKIAHSSLDSIIQRLEKDGLLTWKKYGPITLTTLGQQRVAHKMRHYHLLVLFLMKTLNLSHAFAQKESYMLSRFISCELVEVINKQLNCPEKCICNEQIPIIEECVVGNSQR